MPLNCQKNHTITGKECHNNILLIKKNIITEAQIVVTAARVVKN